MKTLWDKGQNTDEQIAIFTVGEDRTTDAFFACQDILGSLAHIYTLNKANLISDKQTSDLAYVLLELYGEAQKGNLSPSDQDEDIHSTIERILTEKLGSVGKRVHTARSRNDQIATDISLWIRDASLKLQKIALSLALSLYELAEKHQGDLLLGMTHLQPAMPSSIGAWLLGYASLFLDDFQSLRNAYVSASWCPLGSAAGYGVPHDLVPLDRKFTSKLLGFKDPSEPVTAVQGGRGKLESNLLFACSQLASTSARFARDLVLYVTPQFNFVELPIEFTTGSSIMPQKRNPDVLELIRGNSPVVHSSLLEVLTLSSSVPSGYHRDFQRLKVPLLRGVKNAEDSISMLLHMIPLLKFNQSSIERSCTKEIYATQRALQLVVQGTPFRDAYRQVAEEVFENKLPNIEGNGVPDIERALTQIKRRIGQNQDWLTQEELSVQNSIHSLLNFKIGE